MLRRSSNAECKLSASKPLTSEQVGSQVGSTMRRGWCSRLLSFLCPFFGRGSSKRNSGRNHSLESLRRSRSSLANAHGMSLNIVLYGECGVGKTCLRNRWVDGVFTGDVAPTFGVDFNIKTLELVREEAAEEEHDDEGGGQNFFEGTRNAKEGHGEEKRQRRENYNAMEGENTKGERARRGGIVQDDRDEGTSRGDDYGDGNSGSGGTSTGAFGERRAPSAENEVKVNVYDTSGKTGYREVNNTYLLAFDAVLFVYDISSMASLNVSVNRSFYETMYRRSLGTSAIIVETRTVVA